MKIIEFCAGCGSANPPQSFSCDNCGELLIDRSKRAIGHFEEADAEKMKKAWNLTDAS